MLHTLKDTRIQRSGRLERPNWFSAKTGAFVQLFFYYKKPLLQILSD